MFTGEAVCMTDMSEEDTKGEKEVEKKDIKESILSCINISVENICKPVYPHTSHFPGENPNSEILTPPPNQS